MKRFFVFLILFLILTGCQNTQNQDTVSKQLYNQYRQYYQLVTSSHNFQTECEECSIQLVVNKTVEPIGGDEDPQPTVTPTTKPQPTVVPTTKPQPTVKPQQPQAPNTSTGMSAGGNNANTGANNSSSGSSNISGGSYGNAGNATTVSKITMWKITQKGKGKVKVIWKKVIGSSGYQVQYSLNKKMRAAKLKKCKAASLTIKKLKKKKTYYVRVRAYKYVNGKKVYGKWSSIKKVKIKK